MAIIFDAQKKYDSLLAEIKSKLDDMPKLCLASVAIGQDLLVKNYRSAQKKLARELGIEYCSLDFESDFPFKEFETAIVKLNRTKEVTGVILNRPFHSEWNDADVFSLLI